jgi:hypothetical protein
MRLSRTQKEVMGWLHNGAFMDYCFGGWSCGRCSVDPRTARSLLDRKLIEQVGWCRVRFPGGYSMPRDLYSLTPEGRSEANRLGL